MFSGYTADHLVANYFGKRGNEKGADNFVRAFFIVIAFRVGKAGRKKGVAVEKFKFTRNDALVTMFVWTNHLEKFIFLNAFIASLFNEFHGRIEVTLLKINGQINFFFRKFFVEGRDDVFVFDVI